MLNVVFDMDGVILDTERICLNSWEALAEEFQVKDTEAMFRECIGVTWNRTREIILRHQGVDFPLEDYIRRTNEVFKEKVRQGIPVKKGAFELLDFLKENGAGIALASSTKREQVERELKDAGLITYFDELVCGDMIKNSKPAPDIFLEACRRLGCKPECTVGIEDSFNGIRALRAAGMITIMVPDLLQPDEGIRSMADRIFPDLLEVRDYLGSQAW